MTDPDFTDLAAFIEAKIRLFTNLAGDHYRGNPRVTAEQARGWYLAALHSPQKSLFHVWVAEYIAARRAA